MGPFGVMVFAAAIGGTVAGCGSSSPPAPARSGPVDVTATAAGPEDVIVARVDGRPVWGSCVAAQAAAHHLDRDQALADCVAFELLAGAALARGLAADPEVAVVGREAGAVRLVDREFRARFQRFDDLPDDLAGPVLAKNLDRLVRPELRGSYLVRLEIADALAGGPDDLAAGAAMKAAYDQLSTRGDLFGADVLAVVQATTKDRPDWKVVGVVPDPTSADVGLSPYYREALFAIPAIGRVAPVQRSKWGWDLILWTDYRPAKQRTRDEIAASLFESLRQHYFSIWSMGIGKGHRVSVLASEADLRRLWGPPSGPPPTRTP